MAKTRLFGESISPGVIKQLERRAEVLSRGVRNSNDLRYLNEKTSWVRMISGVDTQDAENNFTSEEAKGFILSGGELQWDGKRFIRRRGFNTGNNEEERGRYNYDKDLGIRPEAGITSFSIKHIGTYGVLREADINFNVWTRKDLEKAQNLFLRPGMSVIIEWGNAVYLDNDGIVKDTIVPLPYNEIFSKNKSSTIAELIKFTKAANSFNYEGFLGYITNFTWSYRTDGGYDCSIKAVTKGAVLESLTGLKSATQIIDSIDGVEPVSSVNKDKETFKTYLHYISELLDRSYSAGFGSITDADKEVLEKELISNFLTPVADETDAFPNRHILPFVGEGESKEKKAIYISLNTLCALINIGFSLKSPSGDRITSLFTRKSNEDVVEPEYTTFGDHFSLNPLYCLLAKIPTTINKTVEEYTISTGTTYKNVQVKIPGITDKLIPEQVNPNLILSIYVNLNEIIVDLNSTIDGEKDNQQTNIFDFLKKILKKLNAYLGNINDFDLTFDEDIQKWIIVDRNNLLSSSTGPSREAIQKIDVTGLQSTISNISLKTEITPQLSSQIAISAQAASIENNDISLPLTEFNNNIVDRFASSENKEIPFYAEDRDTVYTVTKIKTDETGEKIAIQKTGLSESEKDAFIEQEAKLKRLRISRDNYLSSIIEAYRTILPNPAEPEVDVNEPRYITDQFFKNVFKKVNNFLKSRDSNNLNFSNVDSEISEELLVNQPPSPINFKTELFEKFKAESYLRFKNAVYGYSTDKIETIHNSGIIPVVLEMTIDGIAGLKIAQIFRIGDLNNPSNILPPLYNSYGFTITALDNTIENGKWLTTIRGLTFRIDKTGVIATGKL